MPKFDVTVQELNSDILRSVEKAISDILVQSFFPSEAGYVCVDGAVLNFEGLAMTMTTAATAMTKRYQPHRRYMQIVNTSGIVGLSSEPDDRVLEGNGKFVNWAVCLI